MIKELIGNLISKKKKLHDITVNNDAIEEKPIFNIDITKENNIFKIKVSDYISITDYTERMKLVDSYNLVNLISNSVLWNSNKRLINKGIYYILMSNDKLYNILICGDELTIDERIKKDAVTEERIINFNKSNNDYKYCSSKNDKTGSNCYLKFYSKNDDVAEGLRLSHDETFKDIYSIISNLEKIQEIYNIFDIYILKDYVLKDLSTNISQRKKTLKNTAFIQNKRGI